MSVRFLRMLLLAVLISSPCLLSGAQLRSSHLVPCGNEINGIPDFYVEAVEGYLTPPEWEHSVVRIALGKRLALWTNGENFRLWIGTDEMNGKTVGQLLLQLDEACKLPADPAAAARLVKVKWTKVDLSAGEFAELHRQFIAAASQFLAASQDEYSSMMASREMVIHLGEEEGYDIQYDNSHQQFELSVWNEDNASNPLLNWVHNLQRLAKVSGNRKAPN